MKTASQAPLPRRHRDRGYATLAVVTSISLVILGMMGYAYIGSMRTFEGQARAQVKQDYSQKEDAILNALIHIVPNKAIGAMRQGSAGNPTNFNWDTIFREALNAANAEQAISPQMLNALNLGTAISANTGDTTFSAVSQVVQAPVSTYAGGDNRVNGGNWWEYTMLGDPKIGPRVPAALQLSYDNYLLDKQYPIVSFDKTYVSWYTKGLGLSATDYPRYNLIQYPDVKFGYKRPGEYFVAKRNWWVFSLQFGSHNQQRTGIPPVRKDYVLSIYEIPSQIPLSASTLLKVGKFADGTDWENVTLDGSLVADRLQTEGSVVVSSGSVSARKSINLTGTTVVNGNSIASNFDDLGEREARATNTGGGSANGTGSSDSDFYDASVGGNVGKVAFIPLNRGTNTLLNSSDGTREERIAPTGWNHYTMAGRQSQMTLQIRKMSSSTDQTPTEIRFRYRNSSNALVTVDYIRGSNWPTEQEPGGDTFPFQTDELDNTRKALIVYLDRLPAFINSRSSTGGMALNNSLYIMPLSGESTVLIPSIPAAEADMAVSLRGGKDLTPYTRGFSLVSRYRVYIADTLNAVPAATPANAGLPAGHVYYPPLSIFAPEKRFGESLSIDQPVELSGQINSLKTSATDTVNPLEFMSGDDERIASNKIDANLTSLKSPAELPPIHLMNWLITIEEVH
jgi:hypothetical protein